jgi:hypothetical protein
MGDEPGIACPEECLVVIGLAQHWRFLHAPHRQRFPEEVSFIERRRTWREADFPSK